MNGAVREVNSIAAVIVGSKCVELKLSQFLIADDTAGWQIWRRGWGAVVRVW